MSEKDKKEEPVSPFAKWEDKDTKVNPFEPVQFKKEPLGIPMKFIRPIVSAFFIVTRVPCVICALIFGFMFHLLKYALLVPQLIRLAERLIDWGLGYMILQVTAFSIQKLEHHREDKNFDFLKFQKGDLKVDEVKGGDLFVCNQTCFADWSWLLMKYSPTFTKVVVVDKPNGETSIGLRVLGMWEIVCHALGINVPETNASDSGVFYSIKELKDNAGFMWCRGQRPIVVFPEGTKTNCEGVLKIDQEITKMVIDAAVHHQMVTHALHFDHNYKNHAPYNTTDQIGIFNALQSMTQFFCQMKIQVLYNLHKELDEQEGAKEREELLQRSIMHRSKENYLTTISWRDHEKFLKQWTNTDQGTKEKFKLQ